MYIISHHIFVIYCIDILCMKYVLLLHFNWLEMLLALKGTGNKRIDLPFDIFI